MVIASMYNKPSKQLPGSRPTIGLLRFMHRTWEKLAFLDGASDAAEAEAVNLVCFTDQRLDEAALQRGWIYDLASTECLDGLIIGGNIGFNISRELFQSYCQRYADLPRVSVAVQLDGVPWISADSFSGMYQAVEHLITVHGHQRIAFIRGPDAMSDAADRYRAYLAALEAHHLPVTPALVTQGDYSRETGQMAMQQLLAGSAPFQAVVAANDSMAFGALEVLQAHGLAVPETVALVGFDDSAEAQLAAIPITTVRQNIYQEGYESVMALLRILRGKAVPARVLLPTTLVVRQSCGCASPLSTHMAAIDLPAGPEPELETDLAALAAHQTHILSLLQLALQSPAEPTAARYAPFEAWQELVGQLWEAFVGDLRDAGVPRFLLTLDSALRRAREAQEQLENWQHVLAALDQHTRPYLHASGLRWRAKALLQQGQALLGEALVRWQAYRQIEIDQKEWRLQGMETDLTSMVELNQLEQVLGRNLPSLGVERCYLALYSHRLGSRTETEVPEPDWQQLGEQAELFLTCDEKQGVTRAVGQLFSPRQLAPPGVFPEARYTFIIQPLTFNRRQMGLIGYAWGAPDAALYGRLTAQLSHALFRTHLIERQKHTQQGLEQRTAQLEAANRELETFSYSVSHDLRAPLNRITGFSEALYDDYAAVLDAQGQKYLERIVAVCGHMRQLIDDLLRLARLAQSELNPQTVDLSPLATAIIDELRSAQPERQIEFICHPGLYLRGDARLLRVALVNLLQNAWKFTSTHPTARIEVGQVPLAGRTELPDWPEDLTGRPVFFVRDDGVGFDLQHAPQLFGVFQRFHSAQDFEGNGVGLATVQRIIRRHGGRIWAHSAPEQGATFYFTLSQ